MLTAAFVLQLPELVPARSTVRPGGTGSVSVIGPLVGPWFVTVAVSTAGSPTVAFDADNDSAASSVSGPSVAPRLISALGTSPVVPRSGTMFCPTAGAGLIVAPCASSSVGSEPPDQ